MGNNLKLTVRNSLIWWIIFSLTVLWFWLVYWAWTAIWTVSDGQSLTSAKWNEVVNRLNAIDQKQLATAWVNFNGRSCTWWAWLNECSIRDSYNVSKVARNSQWYYVVFFLNAMDNWNYSGSVTCGANIAGDWHRIGMFWWYQYDWVPINRSINSVNIATVYSDNLKYDIWDVSVVVYGWKN